MKLIVHPEDDALHVELEDADIVESEEVEPGVIVDYDAAGRIVGVELLHVSARLQHGRGVA